jgi:hypothetical protein
MRWRTVVALERGMKSDWMLVWIVMIVTVAAGAASAHHSAAAYDTSTIVLKSATMKRVVWANPHTILTFDVKDATGDVATWTAESGSPSALTRMGWHRNSLQAGDPVTIELFPARNGARVGRLAKVILPDGRELRDSLGTEGSVVKPVP